MLLVVNGWAAEEGEPAVPAEIDKDKMIAQAVEQPIYFAGLISDAKLEEGVNYFVEIIGQLDAAKLEPEVKTTRIAIMTAYMFKKWSARSVDLADMIAQSVSPELLSPVVAAAAVVMGNQAPIVTAAFVGRVPEAYAQTLRNSGAHPEAVLPQGMLVSIGLPVAYSVPATGREPTALPLAPPLTTPAGEGSPSPPPPPDAPPPPPDAPPPPPVPPTYSGQ